MNRCCSTLEDVTQDKGICVKYIKYRRPNFGQRSVRWIPDSRLVRNSYRHINSEFRNLAPIRILDYRIRLSDVEQSSIRTELCSIQITVAVEVTVGSGCGSGKNAVFMRW